jgi:hypothetical protein
MVIKRMTRTYRREPLVVCRMQRRLERAPTKSPDSADSSAAHLRAKNFAPAAMKMPHPKSPAP